MKNADEMVATFNARNAAHFVEEAEARRLARIVFLTTTDLMVRVLLEAKLRACVACGVPEAFVSVEFSPGPNNKLIPSLGLSPPLELNDEQRTRLGAVFGHAVSRVRAEADEDFLFLVAERSMDLKAGRKGDESLESLCHRLKVWLAV